VPYENIAEGMSAKFELEPGNPRDPEAVRIVIPDVANATAGYVCRGLLPQFRRWLENGWSVCGSVERRNGTADHPLIYLYVTVRRT